METSYYLYENWRAHGHGVKVHRADCRFCNGGRGIHPDPTERNGRWHGPFVSLQEARSAARKLVATPQDCSKCATSVHA